MVECSTEELIALHLATVDDDSPDGAAPFAASVPGIVDALDVGTEAMADRFSLLSAISGLKGDGLVEERVGRVEGLDGERNAYFLTETGQARAGRIRDRVEGEEIRVQNGVEETIPLREVDRYLPDPALPRALARLTDDDTLYLNETVGDQFVNRVDELDRLGDLLSDAAGGRPRTVLVSGEAGIGKTTLVSELLEDARERDVQVLTGTCRRDAGDPYLPFAEAFAEPLAERDRDSPLSGGPTAEDAEMFEAQRAAMFNDVAAFVDSLAAERPVVLFVDDLHSADETTIELFGALADRLQAGALLVGTYRPEDLPDDHPLAELAREIETRHERVDLGPFGPSETRDLVEWLLETRQVPESFVEMVHERTGGNPLFVRESVLRMVENDTVVPDHGVYPAAAESLPIPGAVEDTIDIRLEVLDDDARDVLAHGAVVGEVVPARLLAAAVDLPEPQFREYLDLLVDSHVFERSGDDRLRFTSGVVRETVVDRIPEDRREEIHARVANGMETLYDDHDEHAARIAYHYQQAGDADRALEYYLDAAERATAVYAHEVAIANYKAALDLARTLDRDDEVLSIVESLGEVNRIVGDYEAANRHFQYVEDFAADPERRRRVACQQSRMWGLRGDYDEAIDHAERGLGLVEGDPTERDAPEVCRLLCHLGWARMQRGAFDEAREVLDDARAMAERIGDDELLGLALHNRATVELSQGTLDEEGVEMMERAVDARERAGDRVGLGGSLNNLGSMYLRLDDYERARETLERSRDTNEASGNLPGKLIALNNLGKVYQSLGDAERALECYDEVLPEARDIGARQTRANALANMGEIYHHADQDVAAPMEYFERSLEIQRDLGNQRWQVTLDRYLGELYGLQDDLETATEHAERALELAEDADLVGPQVSALRILGDVHDEMGDVEAAVDYHERALSIAREIGEPRFEVTALTSLVDSYLHADRLDDAREYADRAHEIATELAEREERWLLTTRLTLAKVDRVEGDYDGAEAHVQAVRDALDEDKPQHESYALFELGKVHAERGDRGPAREHLERARDLAEDVGVLVTARKARETLDDLDAE